VTPVITVTPGESASDQELAELAWPKLIAFLRGAR
jgi:hypothetical protein